MLFEGKDQEITFVGTISQVKDNVANDKVVKRISLVLNNDEKVPILHFDFPPGLMRKNLAIGSGIEVHCCSALLNEDDKLIDLPSSWPEFIDTKLNKNKYAKFDFCLLSKICLSSDTQVLASSGGLFVVCEKFLLDQCPQLFQGEKSLCFFFNLDADKVTPSAQAPAKPKAITKKRKKLQE